MARVQIKDLTEDQKTEKISEDELQSVRGGFGPIVNMPRQGLLEVRHKDWVNAPTFKPDIYRR